MPEHELKIWPSYFKAIQEGRKTFETRKADRDFDVGDVLRLREWSPAVPRSMYLPEGYTGREMRVRVTYILRGDGGFGVMLGYVVMAIKVESAPSPEKQSPAAPRSPTSAPREEHRPRSSAKGK